MQRPRITRLARAGLGAVFALAALAAPASAATPVTSCGTTITAPGEYVLTADLNCYTNQVGLTIDGNNIDFSLNGFDITNFSNANVGIAAGLFNAVDDVHVTGPGTITGYGIAGVYFSQTANSSAENLTVRGSDNGVWKVGGTNTTGNRILGNDVAGNDVGVNNNSQFVEIAGNECSNYLGQAGILVSSHNNNVHDNTCNDGAGTGILLQAPAGNNTITANTATGNATIDARDENANCGTNTWSGNTFGTFDPACANNNPVVGPAACTISGTAGPDSLNGTAGDDVICGGEGNDKIDGKGGDDILRGEGGTDRLVGGTGDDDLDGGDGVDTANYDNVVAAVIVDLGADTATDQFGNEETVVDVEAVIGGAFDDSLTGDDGPNNLDGRGGNDTVAGLDGADTLNGGAGNDTITGAGGRDLIYPGDGNDSVDGGTERDRVDFSTVTGGGVYATLGGGFSSPLGTSMGGSDSLASLEDAFGSPFDDTLIARIDGVASLLKGLAGDDILDTRDSDSLDSADGGLGFDGCLTNGTDKRSTCE